MICSEETTCYEDGLGRVSVKFGGCSGACVFVNEKRSLKEMFLVGK